MAVKNIFLPFLSIYIVASRARLFCYFMHSLHQHVQSQFPLAPMWQNNQRAN
jgi:hypothetical protein